jgi:FSR family fosmidomycin resistance protein-like MFS transporter
VGPLFGLLADSGHRRLTMLLGGLGYSLSLLGNALAADFWMLLAAFAVGAPAYSAFVSLAQIELMDMNGDRHEQSMARWVLAGSLGVTIGPLLMGASVTAGIGWRPIFVLLATAALALTFAATKLDHARPTESTPTKDTARAALKAVRNRAVRKWIVVLEAADLMVDVLFGFLALYFVDVIGATPAQAGLAVAAFSAGGIAGSALILPLVARVDGSTYLRTSAVTATFTFIAMLMIEELAVGIVCSALIGILTAGWYSIPKARLFSTMPGRSGTVVAIYEAASLVGGQAPLALGALGGALGLSNALWFLLLGPAAILVLVPRARPRSRSA